MPNRPDTIAAGFRYRQLNGRMTRSDWARARSERPPSGQPLSSAAASRARAMSSTGSARCVIVASASGRSVTWPTPTSTGVWGSSGTRRA